ncbi:hypothetical protein B0H63DRAFT_486178 [Podospora didyma]|uniref:Ribosomal protein bL31m N-terminal domain-containing protein n=1 Tax=Podospora didyma TaxID=330526 RepID=A0AAE0K5M4_9PEZI|nr:hypothetical protein B0H63DRAFT_486178 [Podospora didyma]
MNTTSTMGRLPSAVLRRPTTLLLSQTTTPSASHQATTSKQQVRHATFVLRHRRPYQFTQLVQLSDGSTYTMRTTSPAALYKSSKDTRNHSLWQPSDKSLRNVEVDEAGKLAAFRERFGRGWDLDSVATPEEQTAAAAAASATVTAAPTAVDAKQAQSPASTGKKAAPAPPPVAEAEDSEDPFDSLTDLISSYASTDKSLMGGMSAKDQAKAKGKKK